MNRKPVKQLSPRVSRESSRSAGNTSEAPFIKNLYRAKTPQFGFGLLGAAVYNRTCSRLMPNGEQESWADTVFRVVEGTTKRRRPTSRSTGMHRSGTRNPRSNRSRSATLLVPRDIMVQTPLGPAVAASLGLGDRLTSAGTEIELEEGRHAGSAEIVRIGHTFGSVTLPANQCLPVFSRLDQFELMPARSLSAGDRIVFDGLGHDGLPSQFPPSPDLDLPELDSETAWLVGMIQGNGYVFVPKPGSAAWCGQVVISNGKAVPVSTERTMLALSRFGVRPTLSDIGADGRVKRDGSGTYFRVVVSSTRFATYLQHHVKRAKSPLRVPEWICRATRDVRAAYVAGVFDADGCSDGAFVLVTTVYEGFARDLQRLYQSIGIATEVKFVRPARGNCRAQFNLVTRGTDNRQAFNLLVAPHSSRYRDERSSQRSAGGFTFPTQMVRSTFPGRAWMINNPNLTVARVMEHTGLVFPGKPLSVNAVEPAGLAELQAIQFPSSCLVTAEGVVLVALEDVTLPLQPRPGGG